MKPILVYLSGPITAKHGFTVEDNTASAIKIYWECLRQGVPAFCPHLSAVFPTAFTVDYDTWLAYDFAVIRRCTHVLMLPRWETSNGALLEREYADKIGLPIFLSLESLLAAV